MKLTRVETSLEWMAVATAIYFALVCDILFSRALVTGRPATWSTFLLLASTFALLVGGHVLFLTPFLWRPLFRPIVTLLLIANSVALYFMARFHLVMDESMMRNVMQTDPHEVRDLLNWHLIGLVALVGVLPTAVLWSVRLRRDSWRMSLRRRAVLILSAVALVLFAVGTSYKTYSSFVRNHREARFLITPESYVASLTRLALDTRRLPAESRIPVGLDVRRGPLLDESPRPVVFVLVVGETARAEEFSLDGYPRDTNPSLRAHNVINFPHVEACGTSTADSLPCMFSHLGRAQFARAHGKNYESLLDVMRHAGFRVLWRDNDAGCKGVCRSEEMQSLEHFALSGICNDGECYDEVLLTDLETVIRSSRNNLFLILHQKGSHGPAYYRRYPTAFDRFTPSCQSQDFDQCTDEEIRNAYDNTILYTDNVLGRLIDRLSSLEDLDTAMLYVSDHGESLGESGVYLHGLPYRIAPEAQKHVPMVLWMSPRFASRFEIDRSRLESSAGRNYSHDNLFHSVAGLLDVRMAEYDPSRDIFAIARR